MEDRKERYTLGNQTVKIWNGTLCAKHSNGKILRCHQSWLSCVNPVLFSLPLPMARLSTGFRYQELFKVPHAAHLLLPYPNLHSHSTLYTLTHMLNILLLVGHLNGCGRDHSVWRGLLVHTVRWPQCTSTHSGTSVGLCGHITWDPPGPLRHAGI